jgi:spermidine synthase
VALGAAALLAGAGGLGLEVLLLETAGLAFGHGRGAPLGLALFVAGWAFGAWLAGMAGWRPRAALLVAGVLAALLGWTAFHTLLGPAGLADRPGLRAACGAVAIALAAVAQGTLLPLFVRVREARVGALGGVQVLWVANLAGAVAGAFLLADTAAGALGREPAVLAAGAAALAGAWLAAACAPGGTAAEVLAAPADARSRTPAPADSGSSVAPLPVRSAGLLIGAVTASALALELVTLRLAVLWLGGMHGALAAHLAASLIALSAGALVLPPLLGRGRAGVAVLLALAALGCAWPVVAAPALDVIPGDPAASPARALLLALVLVGPALLAPGAAVPVLFRAASAGRAGEGRRLGGLLLHEVWGALLGAPVVAFLVVPNFGLAGAAGVAALCVGGAGIAALGRIGAIPALVAVSVAALAFPAPPPARSSPRLANPALEFLAFEEDAGFAVSVVDDGLLGERTLLTDGFRAAGDGRDYRYMRALGHLPVLLHPAPARVCVLALGTGTTAGAVSLHPEVEAIEVLELSPAVVRHAGAFERVNRGALDDPRVRVTVGDGRHTLARRAGAYDVVTLEPLLPDSPFAVYLYTREFYAAARRALRPGGLVCQWVPPHALAPEVFDVVVDAFVRAFPRSSLWLFDTQLVLVGGDAEPAWPDAARLRASEPLAAALGELGIGDPARLVAHRVGAGADWPAAPRPLTDADPWIVYLPRRSGPAVLGDLAWNLGALDAAASEPTTGGLAPPDAERARERWRGLRSLARARAAHACDEAARLGVRVGAEACPDLERELAAAAAALGRGDPALEHLVSELAFLEAVRTGVTRLSAGDARSALEPLTTAAELRPERGDVHLYLAAALQAVGVDAGARAAYAAAIERCPRIFLTPPGERVLGWGFRPPG